MQGQWRSLLIFGSPMEIIHTPALLEKLETPLSKEDVRRILRREIRRQASDLRGKELTADFLEDQQLQRALWHVLKMSNVEMGSVPEYAPVAKTLPQPTKEEDEDK